MTRYDRLIDSIKDHLYNYYNAKDRGDDWNEEEATEVAHEILVFVEEFQSTPTIKSWRASD